MKKVMPKRSTPGIVNITDAIGDGNTLRERWGRFLVKLQEGVPVRYQGTWTGRGSNPRPMGTLKVDEANNLIKKPGGTPTSPYGADYMFALQTVGKDHGLNVWGGHAVGQLVLIT